MKVADINVKKVTYAELSQALLDLNFRRENKKEQTRFSHKKNDTIIILKKERSNKIVDRVHLIGTAIILQGKGIIKNIDLLAQLIKKNRLLEKNKSND